MPIYNKLVCDKIPAIIEASGKTCRTRRLKPEQHLEALRRKLSEELEEYLQSSSDHDALEELADLYEVIAALVQQPGGSEIALAKIRGRKRDERGGFDDGIWLAEVHDA